jgi:hypothetical protein
VATNLYSFSGKVRQDGVQLWLESVEPDIWSLGINGPGLTGQKEPGWTRTRHEHIDVPQREILLRNACILALMVTLTFTGIHFNNVMFFC